MLTIETTGSDISRTKNSEDNQSLVKIAFARLAQWFIKHTFITAIIQLLPLISSQVIMKYLSKSLGFENDNGQLTILGWVYISIIIILVLAANFLPNFKRSRDQKKIESYTSQLEARDSEIGLYKTVSNGERATEKDRVDKVIKSVPNFQKEMRIYDFFIRSFSPIEHLEIIADEIKMCFTKITDVDRSKICISLACSLNDLPFEWLSERDIHGCAELSKLTQIGSTFYSVYSRETSYAFFNDKKQAASEGKYYSDLRDKSNKEEGSIICWEVSIGPMGHERIRLIISISTYGKKFTKKDDIVDTMYNERIKEIVLDQFEDEIRFDLALYYLQQECLTNG